MRGKRERKGEEGRGPGHEPDHEPDREPGHEPNRGHESVEPRTPDLTELAAHVADHRPLPEPIPWTPPRPRGSDPAETVPLQDPDAGEANPGGMDVADTAPIVEQLQVIASIAGYHRRAHRAPTDGSEEDLPFETWEHLHLRRSLGRGSFGEVYLAWDEVLQREVALKIMREPAADDERARRDPESPRAEMPVEASGLGPEQLNRESPGSSLLQEARNLARIRHPNVVEVFGADLHRGVVGFWMERIEGRGLDQILQEEGGLGSEEVCRIGIELSKALQAIHDAGLIHRDVKAQNVMMETGGRVVLMDMGAGLDRRWEGVERDSDRLGTPLYASPELLKGKEASANTDLYALGVLLFHLRTGRFPIEGTSLREIKERHARAERLRLGDIDPECGSSALAGKLAEIVDRLVDPDPASRLENAEQVELELTEALARQARRWGKSHRSRRLGVAVATLVLIAAAVGVRLARQSAPVEASPLRVAIAPFESLSPDPEQHYLSAGLTRQLTAVLGTTIGSHIDVVSIPDGEEGAGWREELAEHDIDFVLEGSIAREGNAVSVNAVLLDAESHTREAAFHYERPFSSLMAIQKEMALGITRSLELELAPERAERLAPQMGIDPEALEAYMIATSEKDDGTARLEERYTDPLERAIELEPDFAPAHAALARRWNSRGFYGAPVTPDSAFAIARHHALEAIRIDPWLSDGYAALAYTNIYYDWAWDSAEENLRRAFDCNPDNVNAHWVYGQLLMFQSRKDEAVRELRRACELVPLSQYAWGILQFYLCAAGHCEDALEMTIAMKHRHGDELHEGWFANYWGWCRDMGLDHTGLGELFDLEEARRRTNEYHDPKNIRRKLEEKLGEARPNLQQIGVLYCRLGDYEIGLDYLERACENHGLGMPFVVTTPALDPVRAHPRYQNILRCLGLAE